MKLQRTTLVTVCAALVLSAGSSSRTEAQMTFTPSKDNTIYEGVNDQDNSNGAGTGLFVGRILGNASPPERNRRGLIAFDVSAIPAGSAITSVVLTLDLNRSVVASSEVNMHRLLVEFGEGGSVAANQGGAGGLAMAPDATWLNRITGVDQAAWGAGGGQSGVDYVAAASASDTDAVIGSTTELISDVQAWVSDPASNFGWILIGNESTPSVARYSSSEAGAPNHPELTVTFTAGGAIFSDGFESGNTTAWSSTTP